MTAVYASALKAKGLSGAEIADALEEKYAIVIDKKHASNLARAYENLVPEISEAWKLGEPCTTNFLFKLAAMSPSAQRKAWAARPKPRSR